MVYSHFPDSYFPGWFFPGNTIPGWSFSRMKRFPYVMLRYDTIGEFNVDWKAEYSALSSTRSQKKKLKQTTPVPL